LADDSDGKGLKPEHQQSAAEFNVLLETGRRLAETLALPTILQVSVDGITSLAGLDTAAVYLLHDDQLHLGATFPALPPDFPSYLRTAPLADHHHIQDCLQRQEYLVVDDLQVAAVTPAEQEVARQRGLRTVLYVPMIVEGEAIGAFLVGSTSGVTTIAENRIGLVEALANLAGLTTRNAMLFRDSETKSRELEASLAERLRIEKEREELQVQLVRAQKLEAIGRLAGGVAHDFNNMLQVIQGYTELAMDEVTDGGMAHQHLGEVQSAAERSASITRQLLAFARQQTIAPKVVNLNKSVDDTLQMLRRLVGENLDLAWVPASEPQPVFMDTSQMDQILTNLCVNARDAIADVGRVTIETQPASFDEEYCRLHEGFRPGEYCMLAVSDDGCGFDADVLANLFDPFFTTKEEGTGLGLATVYGIVKQNDGFINVYSEPGEGTTFRIYLPRHGTEELVEPTLGQPPVRSTGGETILVVEDDLSILPLLERILKSHGYEVLTADSPIKARELAARHEGDIQLLITDVVMPDTNGRELANQLRETQQNLLVLFMSGYTSNVIAHRGVLDDDVCFIQKPFDSQELGAKVRSLLDGTL